LAEAAAAAGDLDRAEEIARTITDPDGRAEALVFLAEAAAAAGHVGRAEEVACAINDPDKQALAFAAVAQETEPTYARSFIARALALGDWTALLDALVQIQPAVVIAITSDYVKPTLSPRLTS